MTAVTMSVDECLIPFCWILNLFIGKVTLKKWFNYFVIKVDLVHTCKTRDLECPTTLVWVQCLRVDRWTILFLNNRVIVSNQVLWTEMRSFLICIKCEFPCLYCLTFWKRFPMKDQFECSELAWNSCWIILKKRKDPGLWQK